MTKLRRRCGCTRTELKVPHAIADKLSIMDILQPISLLFLALGAVPGWVVCRWWGRRQLRRVEQRAAKLHADRETLQEQVKQARVQLAQLQKDMATLRKAVGTPHPRSAPTAAEAKPQTTVAMHPEIPSGLVFEVPQTAAHGFADTMPFDGGALA